MDFSNIICPACKKLVKEPINLICDHNLCFRCAEKIIYLDSESQYEKKYKLNCPSCRKGTVTYDLRHLIINSTEYDEDLYVTTKYLNEKPEIKIKSPRYQITNNVRQCQSPLVKYISKKTSIQLQNNSSQKVQMKPSTNISMKVLVDQKEITTIKCSNHFNALKFYCENDKSLLCSQCIKWHKDHKLYDLKAAYDTIISQNFKFKEQAKNKLNDIKKTINNSMQIKKILNAEFQSLQVNLDEQFKQIIQEIQRKHDELSGGLKNIYLMKIEEQNISLNDLSELHKSISQFNDFSFKDFDSQIYFYNQYFTSRKNLLEIPNPKISNSFVWQKNKDSIMESLQKFMKLKQMNKPVVNADHQKKKSHNNSYFQILSANVSRKGSFCQQQIKQFRNNIQNPPNSSKGTKQKQNYKPLTSNVLQLDLKRLKF